MRVPSANPSFPETKPVTDRSEFCHQREINATSDLPHSVVAVSFKGSELGFAFFDDTPLLLNPSNENIEKNMFLLGLVDSFFCGVFNASILLFCPRSQDGL